MKEKKKSMIWRQLALVVMAVALLQVQAQAATPLQSALAAYKKMLSRPTVYFEDLIDEEEVCGTRFEFAVGYVDKDTIPELFIRVREYGYIENNALYTWRDGRVKLVEDFPNLADCSAFSGYYKKTGIYVTTMGSDGGSTQYIKSLKSGKPKILAKHPNYKRGSYYKGGKSVSQKAYQKYVKKVSKKKKLTKLTWLSNTSQNRNRVCG